MRAELSNLSFKRMRIFTQRDESRGGLVLDIKDLQGAPGGRDQGCCHVSGKEKQGSS